MMRSGSGPFARVALLVVCALVVGTESVITTAADTDGRTRYRTLPYQLADDLAYEELPWTNELVPILDSHERDRYLASLSEQFPLLELPGS